MGHCNCHTEWDCGRRTDWQAVLEDVNYALGQVERAEQALYAGRGCMDQLTRLADALERLRDVGLRNIAGEG